MANSPFTFVFLIMGFFLLSIKVIEHIMDRIEQPRVLGEVLLGIILGPSSFFVFISLGEDPHSSFIWLSELTNSVLFNVHQHDVILASEIIEFIAEVGVLFLLFEVGLEIEFDVLKKVGKIATGAAIGGIITPLLGGMLMIVIIVATLDPSGLIPAGTAVIEVALFLGAALTATSVGISIRVFIEMNQLNSRVARTVVGAAVIDDILSILLLTLAITYHEESSALGLSNILFILLKILSFFAIAFLLYQFVLPRFIEAVSESTDRYLPLITGLVLVFLLAWLATTLQLAGIIGSFMAGLLVNRDNDFVSQIKNQFAPIAHWIIPFFFIGVGLRVDIREALDPFVLFLSITLTIVAIVTKIIGGVIGTWFTRFEWHESQLVGIAMSARGEVTLIFAATALQLGFFTPQLFAATILMVILNAVIVPPLLKYTYNYWQNRDDVADIVVD